MTLAVRISTLKVDVICEMLQGFRVQSFKSCKQSNFTYATTIMYGWGPMVTFSHLSFSHKIQTVERRHYVGLLVGCVCLDYCYMQIYAN